MTIKDVVEIALASDDHFKKLRILEVNTLYKTLFKFFLSMYI